MGDFPLSERIKGYWDRVGVEIDLVAVSETTRRIRFGTCKRNPAKLIGSLPALRAGAAAFLLHHVEFADWQVEYCAIAPQIAPELQARLQEANIIAQPLETLLASLQTTKHGGAAPLKVTL
jgi:hypothetical protein